MDAIWQRWIHLNLERSWPRRNNRDTPSFRHVDIFTIEKTDEEIAEKLLSGGSRAYGRFDRCSPAEKATRKLWKWQSDLPPNHVLRRAAEKKHQTATVGSRPHGWRRPGAKLARLAHTWLIITQIASIRFYFLWGTGKVLPSVKPRIGRRVGATSTDDRRWPMAPCSREELSRRHHCPHKERKNHGVLPSFFMILLSFVEFTRRPDIQSLRSKNRPLATRSPLEWWWQHYFPRTEHSLVSEGQLNKPPCPFPHFHRVPLHRHDFTVSCSKFRIIVIYAPSTTSLMSYIKCASNVQQRISSRR